MSHIENSTITGPAQHSSVPCYRANLISRNGQQVNVDGRTLSIAAITAAARYHASVSLDDSPKIKERVTKSRKVITDKVDAGASIYGVSTGFGGSGQ